MVEICNENGVVVEILLKDLFGLFIVFVFLYFFLDFDVVGELLVYFDNVFI